MNHISGFPCLPTSLEKKSPHEVKTITDSHTFWTNATKADWIELYVASKLGNFSHHLFKANIYCEIIQSAQASSNENDLVS